MSGKYRIYEQDLLFLHYSINSRFNANKIVFFLLKFPPYNLRQALWSNWMFEVNPVMNQIKDIRERTDMLRGYL